MSENERYKTERSRASEKRRESEREIERREREERVREKQKEEKEKRGCELNLERVEERSEGDVVVQMVHHSCEERGERDDLEGQSGRPVPL